VREQVLGHQHRRPALPRAGEVLAGPAGQELAAIRPRARLARFEATVEVAPAAATRPDLLPLLGLAWFTLVAMRSHPVVAGSGG
jgi:hypothetical protein